MTNLIWKCFDQIAPLGTAHSHRSKKIIEVAQNDFATIKPQINDT
jgi:hypothetical protein